MTPYETLYGRPCRSPVCWIEVGERPSTGPDLIRDTSEAERNQSTQCMKRHSSSVRGADGISVEVCHSYVVEARRGMLFEQTDEMP